MYFLKNFYLKYTSFLLAICVFNINALPADQLNLANGCGMSQLHNEEHKDHFSAYNRHLLDATSSMDFDFRSVHSSQSSSSSSRQARVISNRKGKVVGGDLVFDGEFPWAVSIRKYEQHHCGGVILNPYWILTAAHCMQSNVANQYTVRVGMSNFNLCFVLFCLSIF